uniref:Large subunit ribosomal protein L13Ae n=1 Tax=Tetraselmis sp. GSL018 TaxID=582737 RepID=A0A061SE45_9CHLO|mmetsp:Transcript_41420/g.98165  ORF Transcript_41420/g.98165 Transcript_41420/m.98165 type:complete len:186 (-) Transcript_41420:82-639(-)
MTKPVIIDCRAHLLGRLASIIAKQLLNGEHVVCVRCEEIAISGGLVRQRMKYERFLQKRHHTNPKKGPFHYRAPSRILWRTIRGMVPLKTKRGAAALDRLKCFEGVPAPYDTQKRVVVPDALRILRLAAGHKFCTLKELSTSVGWKHGETVAELEAARKEKAKAYYEEKKKLTAMRAKALAQVAA